MEGLLILVGVAVGLAVLAAPILALVALSSLGTLRSRVTLLEAQLDAIHADWRQRPPATPAAPAALADATAPATLSDTFPVADRAAEPVPSDAVADDGAAVGQEDARPPVSGPETASAGRADRPSPGRPGTPAPPRLILWLRDNWIYVVSAVSLGLAGIFLVQYGIERGLISPGLRVLAAMAFGSALVFVAERIRRGSGDGPDSTTAYLPSVFASAGVTVLYAAVLAARGLYGLIGAEVAFGGLVAVSGLALVLGWVYGPFLAAAGLAGASVAPFLVGGEPGSAMPFYAFYGLLAATALAIDALRRWGWVSVLGLALAYSFGLAVHAQGGETGGFVALLAWLPLAAMALPRLELWPSHPGPTLTEAARALPAHLSPVPPVWIAAAALAASSAMLLVVPLHAGPAAEALAFAVLAGLSGALALWAHRAAGLADLALIPAAAFLALIVGQAWGFGDLYQAHAFFDPGPDPEATAPNSASLILGLAAAVTVAATWRSFRAPFGAAWAAGAAAFAPAAAIALELFWQPGLTIGANAWALQAIALAALMTLLAERFARADGNDRRRAAYATLAALTMIALSLFILLSGEALTVALAVLIVAAAALDRRFGLPEMGLFLLAGVVTLGWRLVLDPGLLAYAEDRTLGAALLAFGASLAGLGAARAILPEDRPDTRALLEAALWSVGAAFATVLIWRGIDAMGPGDDLAFPGLALMGLSWLATALAQLWRAQRTGRLVWLGRILAAVFGLMAGLAFLAVLIANPTTFFGSTPRGIQPVDTLTVTYLLPAAVFALIARHARWLRWRIAFAWAAGLFAAVWVALEIRWFWRGAEIDGYGFTQPELYSYTVALLLGGAGLLYQALARRIGLLRRVAMTVIAVTVVKVFLVDASGLTGLLRVFSFLALGLALAGLAWLNRWAAARQAEPEEGG
jgi:uncharacterized membrane protein